MHFRLDGAGDFKVVVYNSKHACVEHEGKWVHTKQWQEFANDDVLKMLGLSLKRLGDNISGIAPKIKGIRVNAVCHNVEQVMRQFRMNQENLHTKVTPERRADLKRSLANRSRNERSAVLLKRLAEIRAIKQHDQVQGCDLKNWHGSAKS